MTLLIVEQSTARALELAHRVYVLGNGEIVLKDAAAALGGDKPLEEAYCG